MTSTVITLDFYTGNPPVRTFKVCFEKSSGGLACTESFTFTARCVFNTVNMPDITIPSGTFQFDYQNVRDQILTNAVSGDNEACFAGSPSTPDTNDGMYFENIGTGIIEKEASENAELVSLSMSSTVIEYKNKVAGN